MEDASLIYTVNSIIGVCTCPVGISGASCKHQEAVAIKFHIAIFNFLPSLTPNNRMLYSYIALGKTAFIVLFLLIYKITNLFFY